MPLWLIVGVGRFCHSCFEAYLSANYNDIELDEIIRLSNRESDFFLGNERHR
jgi:hypothetical protein